LDHTCGDCSYKMSAESQALMDEVRNLMCMLWLAQISYLLPFGLYNCVGSVLEGLLVSTQLGFYCHGLLLYSYLNLILFFQCIRLHNVIGPQVTHKLR